MNPNNPTPEDVAANMDSGQLQPPKQYSSLSLFQNLGILDERGRLFSHGDFSFGGQECTFLVNGDTVTICLRESKTAINITPTTSPLTPAQLEELGWD